MKHTIIYGIFMLLAVIAISGCRTARYDLTKIQLNTTLQSSAGVAIAVQDLRPFVISGEKAPSYIGIHRDGVGMPKDGANTRSGKPLAEDLSTSIAANLAKRGLKTRTFSLTPTDDLKALIQKGSSPPSDRILLLRMEQFRSDSWAEVELRWKFRLDIYDEAGTRLATAESEGLEEGLKRNYTGAISDGQAQKALSEKLIAILDDLLSRPDCAIALQSGEWRHGIPEASTAATINQPLQDPGTATTQYSSPEMEAIRNHLIAGNYVDILDWARIHHQKEDKSTTEFLDFLAGLIWEQRGKSDDILVDALSYMCQAIGKSKNPRYRLIMEVVKNESRTRKLRRYAQKSLRHIPADVTIEQYVPGKEQMIIGLSSKAPSSEEGEMAVTPTSTQENTPATQRP